MPSAKNTKSKSKSASKAKTKMVKETPVETPAVVEKPAATTETPAAPLVEEDQSVEFMNQYNELSSIVSTLLSSLKDVQSQMKNLQKLHAKEVKVLQKKTKKKRSSRDGKSKNPSGFTQPTKITDDLAAFLNVEKGTMLPRTEVTKKVNAYIKENGLQWEQNKRHIKPDKKLGKLLNIGKDQELTYFNLQTFLKPHYVKEVKA